MGGLKDCSGRSFPPFDLGGDWGMGMDPERNEEEGGGAVFGGKHLMFFFYLKKLYSTEYICISYPLAFSSEL